jgi:glutamate-1-semialdehyde 2,1-aminomutase
MANKYTTSEKLLQRAEKAIPLGAQTFSKSRTQFPLGVSPFFVERAKGAYVWDVDGNEYVDFASALGAINLGYSDPDVNEAVRAQLEQGTIFTLSHPLEIEVAELLKEMIPCAEKVRFGKNGSDATAGAIRLARAFTGRDHVFVCGYHGWQDWYIGSTARHRGVPDAVRALTHSFKFNDLGSLQTLFEEFRGHVAAVILEPMNTVSPNPDFLRGVQEICRKESAVFVLDETITGFRFANGGAQQLFGVTPDLATFGKGIANGYPLSAICGRADIMALMEEIFFSFTYGGETLSLAAAKATLTKLKTQPVVEKMRETGMTLQTGLKGLVQKHGLESVLSVSGDPVWTFLNFTDGKEFDVWQMKTLYLQEIFDRGILALGSHMITYSHGKTELDKLFKAYDETFARLAQGIKESTLTKMLRCEVLKPLFRVR